MVIPSTSYKEEVQKLIKKKEEIEKTINDSGEILLANQNIGMNGSLLDEEGFPRADIDVYAVRQARHKIICLQNDLKSIMKEIEQGLINLHAEARTNQATTTTKMWALNIETNTFHMNAKIKINFFSLDKKGKHGYFARYNTSWSITKHFTNSYNANFDCHNGFAQFTS